ncbi:FkbM family methyltransferase [Aeromicrobium sp. CTD01-1L150]|uniref:FkbM family methyltransferase n=1 Tax=Aeromicrobium sp. CTD01-1L150 TaxID=3341830 RepID=UPI0035C21D13
MENSTLRAQHGEDRLLAERFAGRRGGYYVEVGALDGETLSNTYHFEKALEWTGVLVEANPDQAARCRQLRPASHVAQVAAVAPGEEGTVVLEVADRHAGFSTLSASRTYHRILAERNISTTPVDVPATTLDRVLEDVDPPAIDFVTIDVEGHERAVLQGFDLRRWRPEVVLVESATGAPDPRISWLLFRAGYARVRRVVVNDWYERRRPPARVGLLVVAYVVSVPVVARIMAREALRAVGLLEALRRHRARP